MYRIDKDVFLIKLYPVLRLLRPQQWVKNFFVLAPLFFSPFQVTRIDAVHALLGFLLFCAMSSAVYILNDYADREQDQLHSQKKHRPIASGEVSTTTAFCVFALLLLVSFIGGWLLSLIFFLILGIYFLNNVAYSYFLKNYSLIDILSIAFGFVLRVLAGAALIYVKPSVWILICTILLALFLAIAKRRDDLVQALTQDHRVSLKGYTIKFIDSCMTMVLSALFVCYVLYTTDRNVMRHMHTTHLYLTVPFVFIGIIRYLQITLVEKHSASPTKILFSDKFIFFTILGWLITFTGLLYF